MDKLEIKALELNELFLEMVRRFTVRGHLVIQEPEAELSLHECEVLRFLQQRGTCIMRELSEHMGLALSTMTGIVDRMVQKGIVDRERPEEDRRIVKVSLTDLGHRADRWHFDVHLQISRAFLMNLTEQDQDVFLVLMRKVIQSEKEIIPNQAT